MDLWSVFTLQGRHKQAVVAIRQAVELVASGSSDWGLYVRIELDALMHDKVWAGADAETVTAAIFLGQAMFGFRSL